MASEPKSNCNTKAKSKIIICLSIIILLVALISTTTWYFVNRDRINNGVFVDDIDIGNLSVAEAKEILESRSYEVKNDFSLTINCENEQFNYNHDDIGMDIDVEEAISQAHAEGRQGNIFKQLIHAVKYKDRNTIKITTEFIYDKDKLKAKLYNIKELVDKQPVDASIEFFPNQDDKFVITSGTTGTLFNVEEIINIIDRAFENNDLAINIDYEPEIIQPIIDAKHYEGKTEKLSSFNTDLGNSSENRIHNIKQSAGEFNGMLIMPEQTISFNETVGDTTLERGYKSAPVIQPDKSLEDSPGGGVCQTASTIYNAVLLSGLEIVESTRHSYPPSYVTKGLDATVYMSAPYIDLKFKNTKDYPVYICSYLDNNKIHVDIYGEPLEGNRWIKIRTEEYETVKAPEPEYIDDIEGIYAVYEGEEYQKVSSKDGYKVKVYREVFQEDELLHSEMLYDHFYRPIQGVVYKGIKGGRFIPKVNLDEQEQKVSYILD